jgi:hypothetical protein
VKKSHSITIVAFGLIILCAPAGLTYAQTQSISSVSLVEATNAQTITSVSSGQTIYLNDMPSTSLSMIANTSPTPVGSVEFVLDGSYSHTENLVPYSLCGKANPDYISCPQLDTPGSHTLTVTPYSGSNATGTAGTPLVLPFTVAQAPTAGVAGLTLVDAATAAPISGYSPIVDGATINVASLAAQGLSITASTLPATVPSVKFVLDGSYTHTENLAPYSLCGKANPDYYNCPQLEVNGTHTLVATSYSGSNATGTAGTPYDLSFTITGGSSSTPVIRQVASSTSGFNGGYTSWPVTFAQPTSPGSAIWVVVTAPDNDKGGTPFSFTLTDTQGNKYVSAGTQVNVYSHGDQSVAEFVAFSTKGDTGGTGETVTFTLSLSNGDPLTDNYLGIFVAEVTGVVGTSFVSSTQQTLDPSQGANQISSGTMSASAPIFLMAVSMNVDGGTSDTGGSGYGGPAAGTGLTQQGSMFWALDGSTALATFATGVLTPSGGLVQAYFNAPAEPGTVYDNEYGTVAIGLQ